MSKYVKNKIIYFSVFLALGLVFFMAKSVSAGHQNAYIACLIDDLSYMYKTQVFYSSTEIEGGRVAQFFSHDYFIVDDATGEGRLSIMSPDRQTPVSTVDDTNGTFTVLVDPYDKGRISVQFNDVTSITEYAIAHSTIFQIDDVKDLCLPLTFPSGTADCTAADINRAYTIADELGTNFRDALLFINDGEGYTSISQLTAAAYGLMITANGKTLVGPSGRTYKLSFAKDSTDDNGYEYLCTITDTQASVKNSIMNRYAPNTVIDTSSQRTSSDKFVWKVKKGYKASTYDEEMEDGSLNKVASNSYGVDTTYISWEHLFMTAGVLYAEGITYSNQADLYQTDAMESSVVSLVRNLLMGLTSWMNLYEMEDLIFNNGVRGSNAFYYGAFSKNWTPYLINLYLIFSAIVVSLVFISIVRIILKKQTSTANLNSRISLFDGIKDLIISLFLISFAWGVIRVIMLVNYEFVGIWANLVDDRTLADIGGGGGSFTVLSGVVVQFTYFMLQIYTNYAYIIRGLFLAALIITSPLLLFAFNFGITGKKITSEFIRQFIGTVFMQSFHAFVYAFLIIASTGARGIEGIVIAGAIIPLTSMFKRIVGCGGEEALEFANKLSNSTGATVGSVISAGAGVLGSAVATGSTLIGGAVGGPAGAIIGSTVGGMAEGGIKAMGGGMQAGVGVGADASTIGGGGANIGRGLGNVASGLEEINSSYLSGLDAAASGGKGSSRAATAARAYKDREGVIKRNSRLKEEATKREAEITSATDSHAAASYKASREKETLNAYKTTMVAGKSGNFGYEPAQIDIDGKLIKPYGTEPSSDVSVRDASNIDLSNITADYKESGVTPTRDIKKLQAVGDDMDKHTQSLGKPAERRAGYIKDDDGNLTTTGYVRDSYMVHENDGTRNLMKEYRDALHDDAKTGKDDSYKSLCKKYHADSISYHAPTSDNPNEYISLQRNVALSVIPKPPVSDNRAKVSSSDKTSKRTPKPSIKGDGRDGIDKSKKS